MASEIRVNQIQNRSGLTTTTFTDTGVTISGILTVSENLNVGGVLTYEDVANIDAIGIVTARAGINLVGNDLNVGSNIKIGNASGIVTATTFVGALTGNVTGNVTGTASGNATISSNADNRIITGGSGNALTGESTLTYSGDTLLSTNSNFVIKSIDTNASNSENYIQFNAGYITYDSDASNSTGYSGHYFQADGAEKLRINASGQLIFDADTNTYINRPAADTLAVTTGGTERLRIDSTGRMTQNGTTSADTASALTLKNGQSGNDHTILELISDPNQLSMIYFGASDDRYQGQIRYKDNDHYMAFYTDQTEKMRISSAGYVTKPAHPSFCARYQSGDGYVSTNIFRLTGINNDNFTWNTGSHYSTSTGKFTCPVAGVYFFEGQAMTTGHSNNDNIQDMMELRTNNGLVTYCRQRRTYFKSDVDANGYYVNGTSGQVNLAVGDTVWFQRRSGLGYSYGNSHYTYFTGWLIG